MRADTVNLAGLGLGKECSEDSVRCAFAGADPGACARWQTGSLRQTWLPALRQPHPCGIERDLAAREESDSQCLRNRP